MSELQELPMAPTGCTLDNRDLGEQLDRYRRLGELAQSIEDRETRLVVTFGVAVDVDLLAEAIAIERACCRFFALDYDDPERRLSIGIDDPARGDALRALSSALRASAPPLGRRSR